jgi:diguanylate cyclase (GGDEF)-like protein
VIRWGGEEFLVLVADATAGTLAVVAGRLRVMVEQARLFSHRTLVPLSISIGGTLAAPGDSPALILRRADALLYQSKTAGRDTVTLDVDGDS